MAIGDEEGVHLLDLDWLRGATLEESKKMLAPLFCMHEGRKKLKKRSFGKNKEDRTEYCYPVPIIEEVFHRRPYIVFSYLMNLMSIIFLTTT